MPTPSIGVFLPSTSGLDEPPGDVPGAARRAEELGFESVWVVDQLVHGTAMAIIDATMALAAAAAVTARVKLGFGVMVVPLRPLAWTAKQVASLQHLSGDRVILGVGVGEDRHPGSWGAAGVDKRRRGRLTDAALAELPDLIAGRTARGPDGAEYQLKPGAAVPPMLVGGTSEAAMARAARAGGWFGTPLDPAGMAAARDRLASLSAVIGRPPPTITSLVMAAISGDPAVDDRESVVAEVADPAGKWAFPPEYADALVTFGPPEAVADHLRALSEAGVDRVVVQAAAGDWGRQYDLLAEASRLLACRGARW